MDKEELKLVAPICKLYEQIAKEGLKIKNLDLFLSSITAGYVSLLCGTRKVLIESIMERGKHEKDEMVELFEALDLMLENQVESCLKVLKEEKNNV